MQELDRAGQAKAAMFPQANPTGSSRDPQDPSHHLYVTSHGAYGAGEQRHRHYDWDRTGLDPASHSFGKRAVFVSPYPFGHSSLHALLLRSVTTRGWKLSLMTVHDEAFHVWHYCMVSIQAGVQACVIIHLCKCKKVTLPVVFKGPSPACMSCYVACMANMHATCADSPVLT